MSSQQVLGRSAAGVPAAPRGRRPLRWLAAVLIGLAGAGAIGWYGLHWWQAGRFVESTDDAYVGGDVAGLAFKQAGFIAEALVTDS